MITEASGGGAGRHVLDLSEGLASRGWDVHLVYSPHRTDRFFRERLGRSNALTHAVCPMGRNIQPGDLTAMRWVGRYTRDFGPFDVIHGHSAKGGAVARLAALATGTPVVYTLHGCVLLDPGLSLRKRLLYHAIEWSLSKVTDRIIAVSPEEQRFLIERGFGRSRVALIPNGIAPIAFPPRTAVRRDLGLPEDTVAVGFIGRLVDQKAPDVLLKAFAMASRGEQLCRLVLVGSGPLEGSLRGLADSLGITDKVLWAGERDGTSVLPAFDLFAMTSRKEGFPYVMLEALAAGLPILATASAGVELTVRHGENGWIVPPDRPESFAAALFDLMSDPRRLERFGRASLERSSRFTTDGMVDRTISTYLDCLKGSCQPAGAIPRRLGWGRTEPSDRPGRPARLPPGVPSPGRENSDETSRPSSTATPRGGRTMASKPQSAEMHPGPGFRVRKDIPRLDPELVFEFRDYATPDISDLLNRLYAMDPAIRCLTGGHHVLCGPACTVKVFPGDNLMVHKALDVAKPGDIVVVDAGGSTQNAVLGDLISTKAKHRKIAGFVVDGLVRDLPEIVPLDFPVFARGTTPIGPLHRGPGEINYPISCGGIVVNPGDLIVADAAGVIVVPREIAFELLERLNSHDEANRAYLQSVKKGEFSNRWVDQLLDEHHCLIIEAPAPPEDGRNGSALRNGGHPAQELINSLAGAVPLAAAPAKDLV
jgi:RraA family protein